MAIIVAGLVWPAAELALLLAYYNTERVIKMIKMYLNVPLLRPIRYIYSPLGSAWSHFRRVEIEMSEHSYVKSCNRMSIV